MPNKSAADYYRPQSSCEKVMFSQACAKNSIHRGGVSQHALGHNPLVRHPPLLGTHSPRSDIPPGQTPPWSDTPWSAPRADTPPGHPLWADTPWADTPLVRHPPGRHPLWADTTLECSGRFASYWNTFLFSVNDDATLTAKTPLPQNSSL